MSEKEREMNTHSTNAVIVCPQMARDTIRKDVYTDTIIQAIENKQSS